MKFLGWTGWLISTAILSLLLAEILVRIFLPKVDAPLAKEFRVNSKRDRVPFMMFGAPPYNGPSPTQPKPEGEYRVFVLGGSTVEHGDPALPECLEEKLHKRGAKNIRVYNYGVVSANSGNQLARLVFEIVDLEPDLVVFYDGVNDSQHPLLNDPRPGNSFDHVVYENHPLISADTWDYPAIPLLLYGSELMRRCCQQYFIDAFTDLPRLRKEAGYETKEWRLEIARKYVGNAIKAGRFTKAHDAEFIWFYQPLVNYKKPRTEKEENMVHHEEHYSSLRSFIQREMAAAQRKGLLSDKRSFDISGVFEGVEEEIFWNSTHILQFARWKVVDAMIDPIISLIKDDPRLSFTDDPGKTTESPIVPAPSEAGIQ